MGFFRTTDSCTLGQDRTMSNLVGLCQDMYTMGMRGDLLPDADFRL